MTPGLCVSGRRGEERRRKKGRGSGRYVAAAEDEDEGRLTGVSATEHKKGASSEADEKIKRKGETLQNCAKAEREERP